jgi:hypothetical protein
MLLEVRVLLATMKFVFRREVPPCPLGRSLRRSSWPMPLLSWARRISLGYLFVD